MNQNSHWYADRPCPQCSRVQALADEASGRLVPSVTVSELNRAQSDDLRQRVDEWKASATATMQRADATKRHAERAIRRSERIWNVAPKDRALSPAQTEGLTVAAVALVLEIAALAVAIWRWRR